MDFDEALEHSESFGLSNYKQLMDFESTRQVLFAYAPDEEFLCKDYVKQFHEATQNLSASDNALDIFSVRLTGNTIDRMMYCQDPTLFDRGMVTVLRQSINYNFDHFHELCAYMAAHRRIIQQKLHDQIVVHTNKIEKITGSLSKHVTDTQNIRDKLKDLIKVSRDDLFEHISKELTQQYSGLASFDKMMLLLEVERKKLPDSIPFSKVDDLAFTFSSQGMGNYQSLDKTIFNIAGHAKVSTINVLTNMRQELSQLKKNPTASHLDRLIELFEQVIKKIEKDECHTLDHLQRLLTLSNANNMLYMRKQTDEAKNFAEPRTNEGSRTGWQLYWEDYRYNMTQLDIDEFGYYTQFVNYGDEEVMLTRTLADNKAWSHTHPEQFPKIANLLETTYAEIALILESNHSLSVNEKQSVLDKTAKIHWLFANMMPYKRGSAAIGHMIAAHLMTKAGIEFSRVKQGICIDIDSFLLPLEQFVASYSRFFEHLSLQSKASQT